jgi:hypothetical protein
MTEQLNRAVRYAALIVSLFFGCIRTARADTCILTASKDNTLFQELPANSFGAGDFLFAGSVAAGDRRALVAFNLGACATPIPAGSTITGATLTLRADRRGPSFNSEIVRLFRVSQNWGEAGSDTNSSGGLGSGNGGGMGTAAQPQDATWQTRFFSANPAMPWTTAGGDFAPQESASTMLTNFPNGTATQFNWSTQQMATDVQGWLNAPTTNFGWIIRADELTPRSAVRFISRNHAQQANWPSLRIDYTPPAASLIWDLSKNNIVDLADLSLLTVNLGKTGATAAEGDFNGDGRLGLRDVLDLRNNLGRTPSSPALAAPVVPEPATAGSVAVVGLAFLVRGAVRRRRLTR